MYGTKVEIKLPKAEPGHWSNLDFPKKKSATAKTTIVDTTATAENNNADNDSDVDLEEIEPMRAVKITDA